MAARQRPPHPLISHGYQAWASTVGTSPPLLPWCRGRYVLRAVRLHEPGKALLAPADLLVADGRIAQVGAVGSVAADVPEVESLRGHVVAPALADLHVHMPAANALRLTPLFLLLTLRHGVVRVRDAGDPDGTATPAARAAVLSGALPGPDIHYAYSFVGDGAARWGNTLRLACVEDAPAVVATLSRAGARWVKAYENLDGPRIAALVAAAGEAGLQVMGHVPTALRIEEAGIPDPQHGFGVPEPQTLRRDHVLNRAVDWSSVTPRRIEQVVEACVRQDMAYTPTLSTSRNLLRLQRWSAECQAPDMRLLPRMYPEVIWHPKHGLPAFRDITADDFDRARDALDRKLALVATLAAAGVRLRLGTDTQQPFVVPGAALHAEIDAFEAAGIARERSWRLASGDAAATLGIADAGRLQAGQQADLLVSPSSPYQTGWSPAQISATVAGGACLLATDMDAAIAHELARFETLAGDHLSRWLARFALNRTARHFVG